MEWHDNPFNRFILHPVELGYADAEQSAALGLERREHGMLLCFDDEGNRWSLLGDPEYVRTLDVAPESVRRRLAIPPGKFPHRVEGWPADWAQPPA